MKKFLIALTILLILSGMAAAHRVHISSRIGEIRVKSWFGGGKPITDGTVRIYAIKDGIEEFYLEGVTDEKGEYGFPPKIGADAYRVEIESTDLPGHRVEEIINMTSMQSAGEGIKGETELFPYQGIIAGLGYLLGLAGIAMLYLARKKNA